MTTDPSATSGSALSLRNDRRSIFRKIAWDELKTRTIQAIRKRAELASYRAGKRRRSIELNLSRPERGTFFFALEELPEIVAALRQHMGSQVDRVVEYADEICEHRFRLLGYDGVEYGREIDWHLDAVHGKKAPILPWFKIRFLDFAAVGDHKVIWELNRHQHFVTLAKAWVLTDDEKYATELISQWHSWRPSNPYPMGINWASSLEVAFRSLSWLWVRSLLANCPAYSRGLDRELVQALNLNGAHIEHYLSTYYSPNTHLLGEAVALFFIGTLCVQLRRAEHWQNMGLQIVLREAERQVRGDGSYFEQSLYYHVYALDFFLHFRRLAERNNIQVPQSFDSILSKMLGVLEFLSQAGIPEGFGDDDGGRVFDPSRNRAEHLKDPLSTGAMLLGRRDLSAHATLTEEAVWLFGAKAADTLRTDISNRSAVKSDMLESAGICISASSDGCAQQMIIDAGSMGMGRGGHGHADSMSVTVSLNGRPFLVDSGTFCYGGQEGERNRFRGTAAHNTLLVDDLDQATPDGPFGWCAQPKTQTEYFLAGRTFSLFAGNHSGYSKLPDPVRHRRFVFHLYGRFWLVRDVVGGQEEHDLKIFWHFSPELQLTPKSAAFVASPPECDATESAQIALVFSDSSNWKYELIPGEVSPAYGLRQPAPVLVASVKASLPTECATAIVPLISRIDRPGSLRKLTNLSGDLKPGTQAYQYDTGETSYLIVFSDYQERWSFNAWESDARFLCCANQHGEIRDLVICDASFVTLERSPLYHCSTRVKRFERWREANSSQIVSSNPEALNSSFEVFRDARTVSVGPSSVPK